MAGEVTAFQVQGNKYDVKPNLTFDQTPTRGSGNPVTSNGIAEALESVAIGNNISVGRLPGSPTADYSICFGTNNVAASDYGIVFGANHRVLAYQSIVSGRSCIVFGNNNIAAGSDNYINGGFSIAMGDNNNQGTITADSSGSSPFQREVYIGYLNKNTVKIYYDPEMTNEIPVTPPDSVWPLYFFDLVNPGDVYEYSYKYNPSTYRYSYVLSGVLDPNIVTLRDACGNTTYYYKGICYYNQATDTNRVGPSDSSTVISPTEKGNYAVYLDINSGDFLVPNNNSAIWNRFPKWSRVKLYYGSRETLFGVYGIYAYIRTSGELSLRYHVYTSEEMTPETDITDTLYDGEFVSMYNGIGRMYQYFKDINGTLRNIVSQSSIQGWSNGVGKTNCAITLGCNNQLESGTAGVVIGNDNQALSDPGQVAIFGQSNVVDCYHNKVASAQDCGYFIAGRENSIHEVESYTINNGVGDLGSIVGWSNSVEVSGSAGHFYITGHTARIIGENCTFIWCNSYGTNITSSDTVHVFGRSNEVTYTTHSEIIGYDNDIGKHQSYTYARLMKNKEGIWTGDGVSYNATSHLYTFPTGVIFAKYGLVIPPSGSRTYHPALSARGAAIGRAYFLGYAVSSDGHTLTDINNVPRAYGVSVYGSFNLYKNNHDLNHNFNNDDVCSIVGMQNIFIAENDSEEICIHGANLKVTGAVTRGCMFVGSWNTMTGTTGAKLVVGNGTADNARSNGFTVYSTGAVAAPSAADTISAGVNSMASTGVSSDKMLITYAQLRDYTSPGGGGSSRPLVTTITLVSTDWSGSGEQTISVSGITSDSIVIVQPSGSGYTYYNTDVYLLSQGTDELIFKCATTPNVDIDVKVVYWV